MPKVHNKYLPSKFKKADMQIKDAVASYQGKRGENAEFIDSSAFEEEKLPSLRNYQEANNFSA